MIQPLMDYFWEAPMDALEEDVHQLRANQTKPTDYGTFAANKSQYDLACMRIKFFDFCFAFFFLRNPLIRIIGYNGFSLALGYYYKWPRLYTICGMSGQSNLAASHTKGYEETTKATKRLRSGLCNATTLQTIASEKMAQPHANLAEATSCASHVYVSRFVENELRHHVFSNLEAGSGSVAQ